MSVHRPKGRFRRIWLPIPSLFLYVLAWLARVALGFVPWRRIQERIGNPIPVHPRVLRSSVTRFAWILLCSGGYVLMDVQVKSAGVRVRVRLW